MLVTIKYKSSTSKRSLLSLWQTCTSKSKYRTKGTVEIQFSLADRSPWNARESCFHNVEIISGTSSFLIWGLGKVENSKQSFRVQSCQHTWYERLSLRDVSRVVSVCAVTQVYKHGRQIGSMLTTPRSHWLEGGWAKVVQMQKWKLSVCFWNSFLCCYTCGQILDHVALRGCRVSILGDIQTSTVQNPELWWIVLWQGPHQAASKGFFQHKLFCDSVK